MVKGVVFFDEIIFNRWGNIKYRSIDSHIGSSPAPNLVRYLITTCKLSGILSADLEITQRLTSRVQEFI